jgi:uncharacterized protein (TIGR02145 family)
MKKLLFILLILSVVTSYAQIPSYVPTNGLVGYWPFNGNANDASGNGNNGVVNGASLTTDRFGNANSSYNFNGNSYIRVPNNSVFNFGLGSYTLSCWAQCTGTNQFQHLITKVDYPSATTSSTINLRYTDNTVAFSAGVNGINKFGFTTGSVQKTQWKHIVAICNAVIDSAYIYVDGVKLAAAVSIQNINVDRNADIAFGSEGLPPTNLTFPSGPLYFTGKLDDIGIYNRALSQSEITGLYNAGTNTCLPSYLPTTGLVGYWPFCGNANDVSGNGNNGTVNGATLTTDRFGNVSSSYAFDRTSIKSIDVTQSATLNNMQNMTISLWCNLASYASPSNPGYNHFINKSSGLTTHQFVFANNINGLYCYYNNDPAFFSTNTLPSLNTWHNLTLTYNYNPLDTSTSKCKFYVDGILKNQFRTNAYLPTTNFNLKIGSQSNLLINNVDGKLDDIAIYNRALTATEVQNLYTASAPNSCIANITNNDTTICRGQSLTLNASAVASGSVTDINGNVYPTVNIGSQTWMQKNLNVSKYKNGDIIPQVTDATQWANLTTGAWCWYNNDSLNYSKYGKLYNWYAVNDPRGLAPQGWHVPSDGEWNKLVKYLDGSADTSCTINPCSQSNTAGGSLKETGLSNWNSPNSGATNISNFTALPSGYRYSYGTFFNVGGGLNWWSSDCFNRYLGYDQGNIFRGFGQDQKSAGFSVRALRNTAAYLWSTGATTPSITVSPTVTTTYYLTVTDANGNTCRDSVKVFVNTAVPSAPATITGAIDVCSNFSSTNSATSNAVTYTAATVSTASSYTWTVPAGVTLVSGQGTNSISVTFANTFVSGTITVKSVNACGTSTSTKTLTVYKRIAATPGTIQKQFTPTSIAAVTNVTGLVSETYRIKKVLYATSYNWSMNRGTSATITHINPLGVNDTAVIVTFANCFLRDTLSVRSVTPCSVSLAKTAILIGYTTPAAVSGITTVGGNFATCIGATKTFTAVRGTPTTSQAPIASFRWTRPANTTIVSATSDSASITVSFNTGYTGGSMSARGVSSCGTIGTTASTAILQFLPPSVLSIASSTGSYNACIGNSITYSALVSAPSTSQVAASVFRWTKPNNTTITSAAADSSTITLQFNTGYIGGTLSVRGQTSCGTLGTARNQSLTRTGCPAGTKLSVPITTTSTNSFEVSLYPNPSAGEFKLLVNLVGGKTLTMSTPTRATKATVKVIDLQGRLMKSFECNANQVTALGNELKPGVYMVEVRMGNEVKTVRAVRF